MSSRLPMQRWLFSRKIREAFHLRRHVRSLLNQQRDLLDPRAISELEGALATLGQTLSSGTAEEVQASVTQTEEVAAARLLPYPSPVARENVKEVLVAIVVIFAFTTFFLQLTKIPTGSMQPTLFGITHENLIGRNDVDIPGRLKRLWLYWTQGISFVEVLARAPGEITAIDPPKLVFPFVKRQRIHAGGETYTIWFPPDQLESRAALRPGLFFQPGQPMVRLKVVAGDHLLVDRFTYNFRRPKRGEIVVFETSGVEELTENQLYIKRLVALPGERVRIGNNNRLVIDGEPLTAAHPGFESVYTFQHPHRENHTFGHVNERMARKEDRYLLAPLFPDENHEHPVGPRHYLVMGDNTLNSADSRRWGDLPMRNVTGRCWFVYWPFTSRFGWHVR